MNSKRNNNVLRKEINKTIISILIPLFIILLIESIFKIANLGLFNIFYGEKNSIFFSILIGYLIFGIFMGITKKLSTATVVVFIIGTLLLVINQIKIIYTGEPLYFSDINFIKNINNVFELVHGNLMTSVKNYIYAFLMLLCVFYFIFIFIWTKNNDIELSNIKIRISLLIVCITILVILFIPNTYTKEVFLKWFLNNDEYNDYESYTTNISYYTSNSLLAGMYGTLLNNRFDEPDNYSENELNNMLELASYIENKENLGTPNIIVLFSESFWNVDNQEEVKFDKEVTQNIIQLKQEGKLIETLTCAYGGMSENVAFELLTGGSLNYFTKGYIPIMSLYKRENSDLIPSIIKELEKNDYKSKIIFGKDYYNSENAMKKIGFDEYEQLKETENNKKGEYISDEYIIDKIIEELGNKKDNQKYFLMAETIQSHMPYDIKKYKNYDISIKESNLSKEENDTILSYAQGIYDADNQLNRLYEYIKEYDEPTVIIFLGDHLPYLYTERGDNALESISYFNTDNELENIYRKYNTQALILSNYNMDLSSMPDYLSYNMLLTYIVNNMDIKLSEYYRWLYSTTEYLPATNKYISLDENGNKYYTQNLNGDMKRINKLREYMQYKFFIKPTT